MKISARVEISSAPAALASSRASPASAIASAKREVMTAIPAAWVSASPALGRRRLARVAAARQVVLERSAARRRAGRGSSARSTRRRCWRGPRRARRGRAGRWRPPRASRPPPSTPTGRAAPCPSRGARARRADSPIAGLHHARARAACGEGGLGIAVAPRAAAPRGCRRRRRPAGSAAPSAWRRSSAGCVPAARPGHEGRGVAAAQLRAPEVVAHDGPHEAGRGTPSG